MNPIIPNQVYINPDGDDDGKSIDRLIAAFVYCHCHEIFRKDDKYNKLDKGDDKGVH